MAEGIGGRANSSEYPNNNGLPLRREYPDHPIPSVAVCVIDGERILAVKRATPPSQGLWSVPGGVLELGETIQQAAAREIAEECGVKIQVGNIFHVENLITKDAEGKIYFHYVIIYLVAQYISGEVCAASDAMDARWVTKEELVSLEMNPVVCRYMLQAFDYI